jgi:hypothetical protein
MGSTWKAERRGAEIGEKKGNYGSEGVEESRTNVSGLADARMLTRMQDWDQKKEK